MQIEVDGERYELNWKEVAVLLTLYWVRFKALPIYKLRDIEEDIDAAILELEKKGLVESLRLARTTVVFLTERGERVAKVLEEKVKERGIT